MARDPAPVARSRMLATHTWSTRRLLTSELLIGGLLQNCPFGDPLRCAACPMFDTRTSACKIEQ